MPPEMKQKLPDADKLREITTKLLTYCQKNDWGGHDPYDALNSRLFRALPFLDFKLSRLALTQVVKRFPINIRPILLVPKTSSSKGIALFLSSIITLNRIGLINDTRLIALLAEKLLALKSPEQEYSCWGYNFDWQTHGDLIPKGSPNIICTTFAANALLDAYEHSGNPIWLESARSAADFILDILFWRQCDSKACFSYTPLGRSEIHNANLLGSALLCRIGKVTGQKRYFGPALDAAHYSAKKQRPDGSWPYGEESHQKWIDNFHTGFNLVALKHIKEFSSSTSFNNSIIIGFDFYRAHFFRSDGAPKYFHDKTYPIDIHSVAQSLITLMELSDLLIADIALLESILDWALKNMWDSRGFFYFQQHRHYTVRTSFIRWSQAWMLFALSLLLETCQYQERRFAE